MLSRNSLISSEVLKVMKDKGNDEEDMILIEKYLKLVGDGYKDRNGFAVYLKYGGNLLSNEEETKKHLELCRN